MDANFPTARQIQAGNFNLPKGPFEADWLSLARYTVPDWYVNGKFGIFIHWGPYCVPAFGNEWYPRNMYRQETPEFAHHVATYGPQTEFGYKDFIPRFTAERFDPNDWADLFQAAGARFVVPVAEHHDGFAMYETGFSSYNAKNLGPKRDIVGELASAVGKRGMTFGVSSHRAEHWWFYDAGRTFPSDVRDNRFNEFYGPAEPQETQPSEAYLWDWLARTCDLIDRYRPSLLWFDWWIEQPAFAPFLQRFAAYYYNRGVEWGQGVAINYKHKAFPDGTAVYDVERGQLTDINPKFWQTDTSVAKGSWGYVVGQDYKTAGSLICDLVDIVSKNGALLLNIGPRADGTIPEPEEAMLREIGRWLAVNGEAIYGTRPWRVYGEGPTEVVGGSFNDVKRAAFTSQDVRFTTKGDDLYAVIMGVPECEVVVRSLSTYLRLYPTDIGEVRLLGSDLPLAWTRDAEGLKVTFPPVDPTLAAIALKITKR